MFPRLALLPIGLFVMWSFVCQRWYVCHIKMACDTEQVEPIPPSPAPDTRPLVFTWDDPEPILQDGFEDFKAGKIKALEDGYLLEITGLYFPGEKTPDGYPNMGLARAARIKALFAPPVDDKIVVETSRSVSPEPNGIRGDTLFEAISIDYREIVEEEDGPVVECITGNNNSLTVLFPYGKSEREVDEKIEKCMEDVVAFLKATGNGVRITGHTDDAGSEPFNQELGLRRARHIQQILVKNGIPQTSITIESRGEVEPVASNATEEGSRQNRRAVLEVMESS